MNIKKVMMCFLTTLSIFQVNTFAKQKKMTIDNYHKVSEGIYRSGQPDKKEMIQLEDNGFKSILNLRQYHSDSGKIKDTSLAEYRMPMDAGKVNDQNILEALFLLRDIEKPVLIHCWHGSDRTGVVVAMYRLVFEDATKEEVIKELRDKKYGYHEFVYGNIVKYIENTDIDFFKKALL